MRLVVASVLVAGLCGPTVATAQDTPAAADGWAQNVGTELRVTDRQGRVGKGRLRAITADELLLVVDGAEVALPRSTITRIERRGDSLKNGFLIGALVGAPLAALSAGEVEAGGGSVGALVVLGIGVYGLMGMGIDAMHTGWTTVYRAPAATTGSSARAPRRQLWAAPTARGMRVGYTRRF
jgi:hypothetical protein